MEDQTAGPNRKGLKNAPPPHLPPKESHAEAKFWMGLTHLAGRVVALPPKPPVAFPWKPRVITTSDGEIKTQGEMNCSKSHSPLTTELGRTLASVFSLNTREKPA